MIPWNWLGGCVIFAAIGFFVLVSDRNSAWLRNARSTQPLVVIAPFMAYGGAIAAGVIMAVNAIALLVGPGN